jgi:hypothetical protein
MTEPIKPEELEVIDACEDCECEKPCEEPEAPEEPKPAPKPAKPAAKPVEDYIAEDGDTYASIAAKLAPAGQRHALATKLASVNKNKPVTAGTIIKVN